MYTNSCCRFRIFITHQRRFWSLMSTKLKIEISKDTKSPKDVSRSLQKILVNVCIQNKFIEIDSLI